MLVQRQFGQAAPGAIVEDYAELTDTAERGHEWAPVHRWAVARRRRTSGLRRYR
ncbi:hypothetical protein OPAG_05080 [Rhodococcus opacus PD630]|nr:hypothetical protein Pd630_LPD04526 [Rhodococcus opacus PD630]EHI45047.1 hypothetical protein OPAG_05080 [Rhodococcus opacus PD630]